MSARSSLAYQKKGHAPRAVLTQHIAPKRHIVLQVPQAVARKEEGLQQRHHLELGGVGEDVVDVVMVEADTEVDAVQSYKSMESPNLPRHATELAPKFLEAATGLSIVS